MRKSIRGKLFLGCAWIAVGALAWAQGSGKPKPAVSSLEVALTYGAMYSNVVTGDSFWMQGGSIQVHGHFWRGLGAVADVSALHTAAINGTTVGLDLVTATFGPRYSWPLRHSSWVVFGQALAGEANGLNSSFPGVPQANSTADSLAVRVGGGVNLTLKHRFALRALDANWLRTQLPNSTTGVQNNLQIGAGIVLRTR